MIDLWLDAHGLRTIATDCSGKSGCYTWKGTWLGSIPAETEAATSRALLAAAPGNAVAIDSTLFNQKRMRLQHVGVLNP